MYVRAYFFEISPEHCLPSFILTLSSWLIHAFQVIWLGNHTISAVEGHSKRLSDKLHPESLCDFLTVILKSSSF